MMNVASNNTKRFNITLEVDVNILTQMYREAANLGPDEPSPSVLEMLESEANWLLQSGIAVKNLEEAS